MNQILIGSDPEIFVRGPKGNLVSAHGMIKGTKKAPLPVNDGGVQVDGMALEYNTAPASTAEMFVHNHLSVQKQLMAMLPAGHKFDISPIARFGKEYMAEQPEEARELGCDPDFDAYTKRVNPRPNPTGDNFDLRTAAGHIHIGWTEGEDITCIDHLQRCYQLVKQLDWFLGVPSLLLDPDLTRRKLYGAPGAFRPKPYGVEYRVLSNFWLKTPKLMTWAFDATMAAVQSLMEDVDLDEMMGRYYVNVARNTIIYNKFSNMSTYLTHASGVSIEWNKRVVPLYTPLLTKAA